MFMKKVLMLCAFAMSVCFANAQDGAKQNIIKVNPIGFLFGAGSVAYERALNEKSSIVVAPQFGGFKFGGVKYSSAGLGAQYRLYFSNTKTAPEGFYAAPNVSFISGKIKYDGFEEGDESKDKFSSFGIGALAGNQWVFNSGFVIDLNAGFSYQSFNYKNDDNVTGASLKGNGVFPRVGFAIGYNF
jgi:Protein of unknown function (DUF3575)